MQERVFVNHLLWFLVTFLMTLPNTIIAQKNDKLNGDYIATKIIGEKEITGMSLSEAKKLLGESMLQIKSDILVYLFDTLHIKEIEKVNIDKDSLLNEVHFDTPPPFAKKQNKLCCYNLVFASADPLVAIQIFTYSNGFFFEHEGFYFELKRKK